MIYDHNWSMPQKGNIALLPLIILLIVGGILFFLISKGIAKNPLSQKGQSASLGGQIFNKAQNPISGKIPETNPLGATKINPFKNIYPNPFDRTSK